MKPSLLILAAGMGSRYGGLKQLDPVGPSGEVIMDYSVFDAINAGFNKVVFVIRHDFEDEFKSKVGAKYSNHINVQYAFQELTDLPDGFSVPEGRVKPWGTSHAILTAKMQINEPFCVINADDFYGGEAYQKIAERLSNTDVKSTDWSMVGFQLKNTLSELVKTARKRESEKIGVFSPIILKSNSKDIWFAGGKINWFRMRTQHITHNSQLATHNIKNKIRKIPNSKFQILNSDYITGCAMLIKKEVFKKTGLLDENFFLYYEDADFCVRAKREGFRSAVVTDAKIKHYEKSEENKKAKTYWLVVSGVYFFQKNSPWFLKPWIAIYLIMRKMKNKTDIDGGKGSELAKEVARAYNDAKNAK